MKESPTGCRPVKCAVNKNPAIAGLTAMHFFAGPVKAQQPGVLTDCFYSPPVQLQLKYHAKLPTGYQSSGKKYPLVYLLHGHTSWNTYANLPVKLASLYNCFTILPVTGNIWHVTRMGQTDKKPHCLQYMTIQPLMPDAEKKYSIINNTSARSIGGPGMGGFGALTTTLKNPQLFGFVFSSTGAINFCRNVNSEMAKDTSEGNRPQLGSTDDKIVSITGVSNAGERTLEGLVFKTAADARRHAPNLLPEKTGSTLFTYIHIDCGSQDDHLKAATSFTEVPNKKTGKYRLLMITGNHEVPCRKQAARLIFSALNEQFLNQKS